MNYCRDCTTWIYCTWLCVGQSVAGCKHDHEIHINMKADELDVCACVCVYALYCTNHHHSVSQITSMKACNNFSEHLLTERNKKYLWLIDKYEGRWSNSNIQMTLNSPILIISHHHLFKSIWMIPNKSMLTPEIPHYLKCFNGNNTMKC